MGTFFSDFFSVNPDALEEYGAFDVSLVNDLPLFIDPFLLFNSADPEYQKLHQAILRYIIFLRDAVADDRVTDDLERAWFMFPEVKQNWLGFSKVGNGGTGLGRDFARALRSNLRKLFRDFGKETITRSSHIEKVCLVRDSVGRYNISDFTVNLVLDFLCQYTQEFARTDIDRALCRQVWIEKAHFNYETESWARAQYNLPWISGDFVLLTPKDILTRDENWINRTDMIRDFEQIPPAIPDAVLRGQVSNYFERVLAKPKNRYPNQKERTDAVSAAHRLLHKTEGGYRRRSCRCKRRENPRNANCFRQASERA
jgi:hypothetical protein